jgi:hypothetical protein
MLHFKLDIKMLATGEKPGLKQVENPNKENRV